MNLSKLFEMQSVLDKRIVEEKGLQGQDLLDKKILALQVELGELANEQRTWKFWSEDQRPRGEAEYLEYRTVDQGGNHWVRKNPLLEEFVDCLHFILSIGLELDMDKKKIFIGRTQTEGDLVYLFNEIFNDAAELGFSALYGTTKYLRYESFFNTFISLGSHLGFTWEQIEQAYFDKNKVNHSRQENGY